MFDPSLFYFVLQRNGKHKYGSPQYRINSTVSSVDLIQLYLEYNNTSCHVTCVRYTVSLKASLSPFGTRQDQDSVIPMYVFGASRTPERLPGCKSKLMRALAREVLAVDCTVRGYHVPTFR